MNPQEMTKIRDKRVTAAYNLEKPDRIPISMFGQGYFKWLDPKAVMADYFRRPKYVDDLMLQALSLPIIDEMDFLPMFGIASEGGLEAFAAMDFAKIKLPGRDLPEDALWNIHEMGPMTAEDYDTAIDKGWMYLTQELHKRIGFDFSKLAPPDMEYMNDFMQRAAQLGKTSYGAMGSAMLPGPTFETLSSARKMPEFFKDIRRIPEKVKAVIDIMNEEVVGQAVARVKSGPPAATAGIANTRAGSDFIAAKVYEKFYHPYYQKIVPAMNELGMKVLLHNDSDWSGFLHYFTEFPKKSLIFDPDHLTPMENIKKVLGDYACTEGNVPPGLIAVGTPDDCYKATRNIIDSYGDKGLVMSVGCMVPANARRENVEAVILATLGK